MLRDRRGAGVGGGRRRGGEGKSWRLDLDLDLGGGTRDLDLGSEPGPRTWTHRGISRENECLTSKNTFWVQMALLGPSLTSNEPLGTLSEPLSKLENCAFAPGDRYTMPAPCPRILTQNAFSKNLEGESTWLPPQFHRFPSY